MSKSKKNVVDPDIILEKYGADTARLFMLSDSPPEKDLEWTDTGINGAYKYLNKLWDLVVRNKKFFLNTKKEKLKDTNDLISTINKINNDVTNDYENFRFNRAIARIREFTNLLFENEEKLRKNASLFKHLIENTLKILGPIVPHFTEELWRNLGNKTFLIQSKWPSIDKRMLEIKNVVVVVQINGKLKGTIELPIDTSVSEIEKKALALPKITKAIGESKPKKIIVVKNKVANIVI
tara:strand:- start:145 stop:855 length:711 start_codon:yes stop_codon:yes gene_type:complete